VKDEVLSAINAPAINMKIIEKLIADYILPSDKKDFNIIICSDDETNRCFRMLNR